MILSQDEALASAQAQFFLKKIFMKDPMGKPLAVDRVEVERLINAVLEDSLPEFMFDAAVSGNVPLMHALREIRGPIKVDYECSEWQSRERLNGKSFKSNRQGVLSQCTSPVDLKALVSTIKDFDLKGLLEFTHGIPFIFQKNYFTDALKMVRETRFKGDLPFLEAGMLKTPELAICLNDESLRSATPGAYQVMLCWATEEMVRQFPESLAPMRPLQRVGFEKRQPAKDRTNADRFTLSSLPMAQFKLNATPTDQAVIQHIELGFKDGSQSALAGNLNHYMGGQLPGLGLSDEHGRVLCETRTKFLLSFPLANCNRENFKDSHQFVAEYFPLDIFGVQSMSEFEGMLKNRTDEPDSDVLKKQMVIPLVSTYEGTARALFLKLQANCQGHDRLLDMMSKDQWIGLAKGADSTTFNAQTLIVLRDLFGLDNQGFELTLSPVDLDALHAANYRFVDRTSVFEVDSVMNRFVYAHPDSACISLYLSAVYISIHLEDDDAQKVLAEAIRLHRLTQSMNLWSCETPKPTSIKQALSAFVEMDIENPNDQYAMALYAYLVDQGIAACAKEAISSEEWVLLTKIFRPDDLVPYRSIMPGKARGRLLEHQLGL